MVTLNQVQEIVNAEFEILKLKGEPVELYDPINYILSIGGKRIRPVLTLMAHSLYSDDVCKAIKPAIGMEMFHNFTLIHDDIMDKAAMRRNMSTVHTKWDQNAAILSGDAMCIKAYEFVMQCPSNVFHKIFWIFNRTALQVCEGQQFDMNFETRNDVSIDEYLKMIEHKTAVLLAACMQIGALTGGASDEESEILYYFGKNIGMAFQLQDDLLDIYGDESIFGKETGKDIVSNKKTYLLIKALQAAQGETLHDLQQWLKIDQFNTQNKINSVRLLYDQLDVKKSCLEAISAYFDDAFKLLHEFTIDEKRKSELKLFANQIKERIF